MIGEACCKICGVFSVKATEHSPGDVQGPSGSTQALASGDYMCLCVSGVRALSARCACFSVCKICGFFSGKAMESSPGDVPGPSGSTQALASGDYMRLRVSGVHALSTRCVCFTTEHNTRETQKLACITFVAHTPHTCTRAQTSHTWDTC